MLRGLNRTSVKKLQSANEKQAYKTAMSIQKQVPRESQQKKAVIKIQSPKVQQVLHQTYSIRYHQLVGQVFNSTDPSILASMPVPNQIGTTNIRKKHLVFKNLVYIISNWTHDKFPNVIYITLRGYTSGYCTSSIDTNGNVVVTGSDRVAALQLDSIQAVMDQSQVRTYQLKYTLRDCVNWQLPVTTTNLTFAVKIDDSTQQQTLPLPSLMDLNLEIRVAQ